MGEVRGEPGVVPNRLFVTHSDPFRSKPPQFTMRLVGRVLRPTPVFETYWRFAAERQAVYLARLRRAPLPWTDDEVLQAHRFTNVFRASDRVSQYLIAVVQRG